tara:strand:+ start:4229 stop:4417 length:189 start_codon:yes stop_codon:yes gene_type:complete
MPKKKFNVGDVVMLTPHKLPRIGVVVDNNVKRDCDVVKVYLAKYNKAYDFLKEDLKKLTDDQ